ncbi:hypothetical protein, partial [Streptomyces sp. NPDC048710]|uniref:hypothetical protein n=1 Tax=Streptomyces sp. NPDC048710 TaxID=3365586 RepID=UPI0037154120
MNTGLYPVQDPVDHLPMATPPLALTVSHRQGWPQTFPLRMRQITAFTPPHTRNSEPIRRQT